MRSQKTIVMTSVRDARHAHPHHPPDIWFFLLVLLVARRCGLFCGAPTAGLDPSTPRTCGRVGWPLFPLHLLWLSQFARFAERIDTVPSGSLGRSRFGGFLGRFLGGLCWRTSPGTGALGHRCSYGHPFSLADSVAETCNKRGP